MRVRFWGTRGSIPVSLTWRDLRDRLVEALVAANGRQLDTMAKAHEFVERLPQARYAFLGDTARLPYGSKSRRTIARYAAQSAQFLVREQGAEFLEYEGENAGEHDYSRRLCDVRQVMPRNATASTSSASALGRITLQSLPARNTVCRMAT